VPASIIFLLSALVHFGSFIERVRDFDENQGRMGGQVRRILAATLIWLSCCGLAWTKDLALISNKSNSVQPMTLQELTKISKGQVEHWPDGKAVSFVTRDPTLPDMKILLEKVYGMSKEEVKALIASANHGRTNHPAIMVVETDEEAVKQVESTPGAVGVVDVYSISGAVTVVKLGGKLPLEPGYPLHGN